MKKLIVTSILSVCIATGVSAQVKAYKTDNLSNPNSVAYALPQTVVKVRIEAEKECVKVGPYARFAQKLLGVMAPLSDKSVFTIKQATITSSQEADPSEVYALDNPDKGPAGLYVSTPEGLMAPPLEGMPALRLAPAKPLKPGPKGEKVDVVSYVTCDTAFLQVPVDKQSTMNKSLETLASEAAEMIFSLRRHRIDLVTGEAGENVFGGGLKAALDEIDRLEQEYLSLFLGKQYRQRVVEEFSVIPQAGENTVVVCRFSENGGLLPASDLSGRPITLELNPEGKTANSPWVGQKSNAKGSIYYRIADMVNCRLTDGNREIAVERMPIYQYGVIVQMPVSAIK